MANNSTNNHIVLLSLIGLILVIMLVLGYALYVVKDTFGIHLTRAGKESKIEQIENDNLTEIKWKKYENKKEGFSLKYPLEWSTVTNDKNIFSAKKMLSQKEGAMETNVLVFAMNVLKIENEKKLKIEDFLKQQNKKLKNNQILELSGKDFLRTGKIELESGLSKDYVYWQKNDKGIIYCLEGVYYYDDLNSEKIFEKMIESLNVY